VFLNAQFEGAAAGEVFNAAGKTDILIRAEVGMSSSPSARSGEDPRQSGKLLPSS
jgi:hypothetical protein